MTQVPVLPSGNIDIRISLNKVYIFCDEYLSILIRNWVQETRFNFDKFHIFYSKEYYAKPHERENIEFNL